MAISFSRTFDSTPIPFHRWTLDGTGADAMGRTHLVSASTEADALGMPLFQHERGNTVGVFGGCSEFHCYGRALASEVPVELGTHFTVSAWVYWEKPMFEYDHHTILSNGQITVGKRANHFEVIAGNVVLSSSIPIRHAHWMHVVVTRDDKQLTLWIDGNPSRLEIEGMPAAEKLYIGRNESGYPWSGMIDDVTIWNGTFSAARIAGIR